ncbi:MAG TPA: response regulator [Rhizomicrobium sp.]|jgi:DNA-binding response OmpR family regulator|nr:response regulator [Rhizomicrobium sp.]
MKALVVEDEALIRLNLCDMLEEMGLETAQAANGSDGLQQLEHDAAIGVLIADLGLHGMSGDELVRRARALRPQLTIIVASGRSGPLITQLTSETGARYLGKPFDFADLRRAVEGQ